MKILKKVIYIFIFTLMSITVIVYAADMLSASSVEYKSNSTVEEALNDLYSKVSDDQPGVRSSIYVDGTLDNDISDNGTLYLGNYTCQNGTTITYNNGKFAYSNVSGHDSCIINMMTTTEKVNLNIANINSYEADSYSSGNGPENAIDDSMRNGKGRNWYGGTKLLITYNTLSHIEEFGVYTTDNWGYAFSSATIYYSNDDSLTLNSDLSNFQSVTISTESDVTLDTPINAKRVMLVKREDGAVYEFRALGYGQ